MYINQSDARHLGHPAAENHGFSLQENPCPFSHPHDKTVVHSREGGSEHGSSPYHSRCDACGTTTTTTPVCLISANPPPPSVRLVSTNPPPPRAKPYPCASLAPNPPLHLGKQDNRVASVDAGASPRTPLKSQNPCSGHKPPCVCPALCMYHLVCAPPTPPPIPQQHVPLGANPPLLDSLAPNSASLGLA